MQAIRIIRKTEQLTTTWSGGTTTEMAIYPLGATYIKRDFVWRISTAVIKDETSGFTALPGFWRILMVIDGELELVHKGYHSARLCHLEQDQFSGDWETTSVGKATDFNVMLAQGYVGNVEAFTMESGAVEWISLSKTSTEEEEYSILYTPGYDVLLIGEGYRGILERGDVIVVDGSQIPGKWNLAFRNDNPVTVPLIHCTVRKR